MMSLTKPDNDESIRSESEEREDEIFREIMLKVEAYRVQQTEREIAEYQASGKNIVPDGADERMLRAIREEAKRLESVGERKYVPQTPRRHIRKLRPLLNRKILIAASICALVLCGFSICTPDNSGAKLYTYYDELSDEQKASIAYTEYDNSVFADIDPVGVQRVVVIEDMVIPLNVEFEDNDKALEAVKTQCSDILSYMQEELELDEISDSNWQKYQNRMVNVPNSEMSDQYYLLDQFFDIYENKTENDQIAQKLQTKTSIDAVLSDDDIMSELGFGDEIRQQVENR